MTLLTIDRVLKSYGRFAALDGVSFDVAEGELFGLLGPNGAGKSTLISILSGLTAADAGAARLDGRTLSPRDPELRRLIGIAPQDLAIYEELTARENLHFFGELYGMRGAALRGRADEVLAAVELSDRADHRAGTFSGGMKRRLNLGVAVLHRPRILYLDEPTTGVDPQSRNHIFEEVRRLNRDGMTIIYTSHYMEEVQALCPRVGVLDHGKLIACDTLAGLLRLLPTVVAFRVPEGTAELRRRLSDGAELTDRGGGAMELRGPEVQPLLMRLLAVVNELNITVTRLETTEPNLERVFLHLTGRGLRD